MNLRALGIASLLVPFGCVLLVHPSSGLGTTCDFAGRTTTPCGRCIASACQGTIDACCADKSCNTDALDACASSGACADLFATTSAVASCVSAGCAGTCASSGDGAAAETSGSVHAECAVAKDGESCTCTVAAGDAAAPARCDAVAVGAHAARCCVKETWPLLGATCRCDRVRCVSYFDNCSCEINNALIDDTAAGCSKTSYDWTCCVSDERKYCYCAKDGKCQSGSSLGGESCGPSDLPCASDERAVATCDVE
jgi:hypothetical protein